MERYPTLKRKFCPVSQGGCTEARKPSEPSRHTRHPGQDRRLWRAEELPFSRWGAAAEMAWAWAWGWRRLMSVDFPPLKWWVLGGAVTMPRETPAPHQSAGTRVPALHAASGQSTPGRQQVMSPDTHAGAPDEFQAPRFSLAVAGYSRSEPADESSECLSLCVSSSSF